jgi:hypothetical protein
MLRAGLTYAAGASTDLLRRVACYCCGAAKDCRCAEKLRHWPRQAMSRLGVRRGESIWWLTCTSKFKARSLLLRRSAQPVSADDFGVCRRTSVDCAQLLEGNCLGLWLLCCLPKEETKSSYDRGCGGVLHRHIRGGCRALAFHRRPHGPEKSTLGRRRLSSPNCPV